MALPRVSVNLPRYNPSKSTLAFGDRALPKIRRELGSSDVDVIRQALLLLSDLLHKPENITSACREGLVDSLSFLLTHDDPPVRYRSANCLQLIAEHAIGRQAFLKLSIIPALAKLFTDTDITVRTNAHLAIEMCSRTQEGVEGVLSHSLVPSLIQRLLLEEETSLKVPILDTLHWCLQVDPMPGLNCQSIEKLHPLLSHTSSEVRWRVARCLFDLTVPHEGKVTSCECDVISDLVSLLTDSDPYVRTHSTSALMSILVITDGKYALLKTEGLSKLVLLLHDSTSNVRLNATKCITLLAEAPEGKKELIESLDKVKLLQSDINPVISKAAVTAYKVITWKP